MVGRVSYGCSEVNASPSTAGNYSRGVPPDLRRPPATSPLAGTAGGAHRPSITSTLGEYTRMVRLKSPVGAGNQFDCFSTPGDVCCMYRSREPSAFHLRASRSPKAYRFSSLDVGNPSLSYNLNYARRRTRCRLVEGATPFGTPENSALKQ